MSAKTKKIVAFIFILLPALLTAYSGFVKLSGNEMVVDGLTKMGYGSYIRLLGIAEIIFVVLLFIPKTYKLGFVLLLSYWGGAAALEVSTRQFPVALVLITFAWIGVYLKDRKMFLASGDN